MASKEAKEKEDPILQRLDTIIRLQARIAVQHLETQKDKILFLGDAGLGPKAIGEILSITANHAHVTLVAGRKKKKATVPKSGETSNG